MQNILEYLIIGIQLIGFAVILIKIGIFIGTVKEQLQELERRIRCTEIQIKNVNRNFDKHIIGGRE